MKIQQTNQAEEQVPTDDIELAKDLDKENEAPKPTKKEKPTSSHKVPIVEITDDEHDPSDSEESAEKKAEEVEEKEEEKIDEKANEEEQETVEKPVEAEAEETNNSNAVNATIMTGVTSSPLAIEQGVNPFKELDEEIGKLPETMFGVTIRETGSASMANQLVLHQTLLATTIKVEAMIKENNNAAGHVKSIHDMFQTFTKAEKAGNKEWKKATEDDMKAEMAQMRQEHETKQKELDREIQELKRALAEKEKTVEETKDVELEEAEDQRKAVKRNSSDAISESQSKVSKTDEKALTPAEKIKIAQALKKKKTQFNCIFCVNNDHKTVECDRYTGTTARRDRMLELGFCLICGRNHPGGCRFMTSKECDLCNKRHLTQLCDIFDQE